MPDVLKSTADVPPQMGFGQPPLSASVVGANTPEIDYVLAFNGDSVLSGGIAVLYLFMDLLSELANQKYLEMQEKAKVSRDAQDKANEVNEVIAKVSKEGDKGAEPLPQDVIDYMRENGIQVDGKSIDDYLKHPVKTPEPQQHIFLTSSDGRKLDLFKFMDGSYQTYAELDDGKGGVIRETIDPSKVQVSADGNTVTYVLDGKSYTGTYRSNKPTYDDLSTVKLDKGQLEAVKDALENVSNRASDFVSQAQLQLQKIMQTYNVSVSLINSMQTMLEEMNKSIAQNIR